MLRFAGCQGSRRSIRACSGSPLREASRASAGPVSEPEAQATGLARTAIPAHVARPIPRHAPRERQRRFVAQPRVAAHRPPWESNPPRHPDPNVGCTQPRPGGTSDISPTPSVCWDQQAPPQPPPLQRGSEGDQGGSSNGGYSRPACQNPVRPYRVETPAGTTQSLERPATHRAKAR